MSVHKHSPSHAGGAAGQRRALVIANGEYTFIQLPGVKKDFEAMTAALADRDRGNFAVTALLDKGLLEVRRAIAEICAKSGPADTLLIYYTGASFLAQDGLFLPVADSDKEYPDATAVDAEFILSRLRRSECRRLVLLVDGCHSGAFFNNNRGIPDGLMAITACAVDQMTEDTPEGGAFTRALVAAFESPAADRDGDGKISVDELHELAQAWLRDHGFKGTPQKWVWNVREPIHVASSPPRVFLSYCRADVAVAEQVKHHLEAAGFSVWLDLEGIRSGDWKRRVTEGLNRARALVYILTPRSLESEAAKKELEFAAAKRLPILPLVVGPLRKEDLPDWYVFDYASIHRLTFDTENPAEHVEKLVRAIREAPREYAAGGARTSEAGAR